MMHVKIANDVKLYGLTDMQQVTIKEALIYDNPAYKNAKKYSKRSYISIPPYLYYYKTGKDSAGSYIEFPIGFDFQKALGIHVQPQKGLSVVFSENRPYVDFPDFKLDLRPIQQEAMDAYFEAKHSTRFWYFPPSIISLPTGKGKTILALAIAHELKTRTLILVHKDDLVAGWKKDIELCFGKEMKVGLIKAKKREIEDITIATPQTLSRMSEEEFNLYKDQFGLVIQDEVHRVGLNIFNVADRFNSMYKLGLSATPKRSDGLNFVFDLFFGGICYEYKAGRDDEDISNVEVHVINSGFKYTPFIHKGEIFNYHDFKPSELPNGIAFIDSIPYNQRPNIPYFTIDNQAVLSNKTRLKVCSLIVDHYRQGHSILVMFSQKEHLSTYFHYLKHYIPFEKMMLYYGDSKEKSADMMEKAEKREVLVTLATYAKATEGTNVKAWEVEFLVSSLNNEKNVEQATGRVRRRTEGKLDPVIVYDVRYPLCYSLSNHYKTRKKVYEELGYTIVDRDTIPLGNNGSLPVFSRGYRVDKLKRV